MEDQGGLASDGGGVFLLGKTFITSQGVGVIRDIDERLPCTMIVGLTLAVWKGTSYGFRMIRSSASNLSRCEDREYFNDDFHGVGPMILRVETVASAQPQTRRDETRQRHIRVPHVQQYIITSDTPLSITTPTTTMSSPVKLYVYDLSNGMVRAMSMQLVGRQIDGIW